MSTQKAAINYCLPKFSEMLGGIIQQEYRDYPRDKQAMHACRTHATCTTHGRKARTHAGTQLVVSAKFVRIVCELTATLKTVHARMPAHMPTCTHARMRACTNARAREPQARRAAVGQLLQHVDDGSHRFDLPQV